MKTHHFLIVYAFIVSIVNVDILQAYRIDVHNHIIPSFYSDWLREIRYLPLGSSPPAWNASLHMEFMESTGVKTSVVSITTPGIGPFSTSIVSLTAARAMARKLNEYCAFQLVRKFPGKFQFWATMTLPDVDGSIAEAKYALKNLKAAGVLLESNKLGVYLGDPSFDSFLETLNDLHAIVFIHPTYLPNVSEVPGLNQNVVDFTLDLTRTAINLVFTNTTQKYPNITFVLGNAGGTLPFVAYRAALSSKYYSGSVMIDEFKKFHYDTAFSTSPSAMPTLMEFATSDRMVFGSDWPHGANSGSSFYTQTLDSYSLSDEDRIKINSSNIEKVLKRTCSITSRSIFTFCE